MKKTIYLGVLIFLFLGCFSIGPVVNYKDWIPIFTLLWIFLGYSMYKPTHHSMPIFAKCFTFILIASTVISFISAFKNYNITFIQSLVTNRQMFLYLAIPILFRIKPSENEIFKVLKFLFLLSFFVKVIELVIGINIFNGTTNFITQENLSRYGIFLEGMPFWIVLVYFFITQWFNDVYNKKKLIYAIIGGTSIVITYNRGLTIPFIILVSFFYMYKINKSKWFIVLIVLSIAFVIIKPIILDMITETQEQVSDEDYARNSAIRYFLLKSTPGYFEYIFGNSMIGTSNAISASLLNYRISNLLSLVDIGWIGFYHLYGLFPIIFFLILFFKIIHSNKSPIFLKMTAIHIMFPIGWNMWMSQYMLIAILMIYLYYYYQKKTFIIQKNKKYESNTY